MNLDQISQEFSQLFSALDSLIDAAREIESDLEESDNGEQFDHFERFVDALVKSKETQVMAECSLSSAIEARDREEQ